MRSAGFIEAMRAARNLAGINVRAGEDVLIVSSTDQHDEIHQALIAACEAAGAGSVASMLLAPPVASGGYRHPVSAIAAGRAVPLVIVATSMAFPRAYDDLTEAILEAGGRLVLINNAPPEDFSRGAALAEPDLLLADTRRLAAEVSAGRQVRVRSAGGTDLTVGVNRPCFVLTGHADEETGFGSFPSGEAMLSAAEGTATGRFVADGFSQVVYLEGSGPQIGLIDEPIRLEFKNGRLVEFSGGADSQLLDTILKKGDGNARLLGELGLGTNPMARPVGHVENKFRLGTAHVALGDNHLIGWRSAGKYGGTIKSGLHIDLVSEAVTVEIDGRTVIEGGRLLV